MRKTGRCFTCCCCWELTSLPLCHPLSGPVRSPTLLRLAPVRSVWWNFPNHLPCPCTSYSQRTALYHRGYAYQRCRSFKVNELNPHLRKHILAIQFTFGFVSLWRRFFPIIYKRQHTYLWQKSTRILFSLLSYYKSSYYRHHIKLPIHIIYFTSALYFAL